MRRDAAPVRPVERRKKRVPPPLDPTKLHDLALFYVGRFATTQAKLSSYLARKVKERGWAGEGDSAAQIEALAGRLAELGYVDDASYAVMKSGSLTRRGYGLRRVTGALSAAGVAEPDQEDARALAEDGKLDAIWRFAMRKRLGPFAAEPMTDHRDRERALAALLRAGHDIDLSRRLLAMAPGAERSELEDES